MEWLFLCNGKVPLLLDCQIHILIEERVLVMSDLFNVADIFGEDVFSDAVMEERLPKKVYKELRKTIDEGKELDPMIAEVVAGAMKDWAIEKGATHYTHWFQPLTLSLIHI